MFFRSGSTKIPPLTGLLWGWVWLTVAPSARHLCRKTTQQTFSPVSGIVRRIALVRANNPRPAMSLLTELGDASSADSATKMTHLRCCGRTTLIPAVVGERVFLRDFGVEDGFELRPFAREFRKLELGAEPGTPSGGWRKERAAKTGLHRAAATEPAFGAPPRPRVSAVKSGQGATAA